MVFTQPCNLEEKAQTAMVKGTFSYKHGNEGDHRFQNILVTGQQEFVRVIRISLDTAAIQCYTSQNCEPERQISLSSHYTLVRINDTEARTKETMHRGEFIIAWQNSYELLYNDLCILRLSNQRQQSRHFEGHLTPILGYP